MPLSKLRCFALRFTPSHSNAIVFFAMHSWEIVMLTTSGNRVTLYRLKMTPLPGYWDADHDRPRARNIYLVMYNVLIFVLVNPHFQAATSILLLSSVILASNRK